MWQARFYQSLPQLVEAHPKARWLFLTLTVRNCPITDLRNTLQHMNQSWRRLVARKEFKPVLGWVRTTEVTRGKDGSAHPHFHALLMVPPSWFTRDYVKHSRWVELWGDCLRVDYAPNVDVRAVKPRAPKSGQTPTDATAAALQGAVAETLKYSTKPADMVADESWFLELTRQTHKLRFVATGGALKDVLKVDEETDADLALADGPAEGEDDGSRLAFNWRSTDRRYRRFPKADKGAE
jgi:plasmid rolling circle replication initiator protein Rep